MKARKVFCWQPVVLLLMLEMREQYHPKPTSTEWTAASPDSNSDGIHLGQSVGAVNFMSSAWWSPSYTMPGSQTISLIANENVPGSIMVNRIGKRFTNETQPYEDVVKIDTCLNSAVKKPSLVI